MITQTFKTDKLVNSIHEIMGDLKATKDRVKYGGLPKVTTGALKHMQCINETLDEIYQDVSNHPEYPIELCFDGAVKKEEFKKWYPPFNRYSKNVKVEIPSWDLFLESHRRPISFGDISFYLINQFEMDSGFTKPYIRPPFPIEYTNGHIWMTTYYKPNPVMVYVQSHVFNMGRILSQVNHNSDVCVLSNSEIIQMEKAIEFTKANGHE